MARFWFALLFVLLISYHVVADTPSDVKLRQLIEQATKEAQMEVEAKYSAYKRAAEQEIAERNALIENRNRQRAEERAEIEGYHAENEKLDRQMEELINREPSLRELQEKTNIHLAIPSQGQIESFVASIADNRPLVVAGGIAITIIWMYMIYSLIERHNQFNRQQNRPPPAPNSNKPTTNSARVVHPTHAPVNSTTTKLPASTKPSVPTKLTPTNSNPSRTARPSSQHTQPPFKQEPATHNRVKTETQQQTAIETRTSITHVLPSSQSYRPNTTIQRNYRSPPPPPPVDYGDSDDDESLLDEIE